jgi:hypothetical protein
MQIPLRVSTRIMASAENENENVRDLCADEESDVMRALQGHARAVALARLDETKAMLTLLKHYQARATGWQREARRWEANSAADRAQARGKLAILETALAQARGKLAILETALAAAQQKNKELYNALHTVEVIEVETGDSAQIVRGDVEPASKRLKTLQKGASELQAQAVQAHGCIKQENAQVAEDLEVGN